MRKKRGFRVTLVKIAGRDMKYSTGNIVKNIVVTIVTMYGVR